MHELEIERKFIVDKDKFFEDVRNGGWEHYPIRQAYFAVDEKAEPRIQQIRVSVSGHENYEFLKQYDPKGETYRKPRALINIKSYTDGAWGREEFEYEIPVIEGVAMFDLGRNCIYRERYCKEINGVMWEVDNYKMENEGLLTAEVEIPNMRYNLMKPNWVVKEVTDNERYWNASLSKYPYNCFSMEPPNKVGCANLLIPPKRNKCKDCHRYGHCHSRFYDEAPE